MRVHAPNWAPSHSHTHLHTQVHKPDPRSLLRSSFMTTLEQGFLPRGNRSAESPAPPPPPRPRLAMLMLWADSRRGQGISRSDLPWVDYWAVSMAHNPTIDWFIFVGEGELGVFTENIFSQLGLNSSSTPRRMQSAGQPYDITTVRRRRPPPNGDCTQLPSQSHARQRLGAAKSVPPLCRPREPVSIRPEPRPCSHNGPKLKGPQSGMSIDPLLLLHPRAPATDRTHPAHLRPLGWFGHRTWRATRTGRTEIWMLSSGTWTAFSAVPCLTRGSLTSLRSFLREATGAVAPPCSRE